ncbi:sulfotransferase domain-containing protein [Candidatus Protochlamydia phocaeensis]|uniref:sulfotransferase domain-containing protein n=1 Tax=Candidatus Protochlamydia phocaeensis TaxID=1414722 RepID=UPI0008398F8D|nr:sulfotransferase domain-containing protein [Candidatus Protochlamydia phocaeensis]
MNVLGMNKILSWILAANLLSFPLVADEGENLNNGCLEECPIRDFYLITLPKSGSHLLIKALVMLTDRYPYGLHHLSPLLPAVSDEQFEQVLQLCKDDNHFAFNHTGAFGNLFAHFSQSHPDYLKILMIRDLRDALVSYVYHISPSLEEQFGSSLSFDEKLALVLDLAGYEVGKAFERDVVVAIDWMRDPDVLVNRFEDLVGSIGGGSSEKQQETLFSLSKALGIALQDDKLRDIQEHLFGNDTGPKVSGTFRSGQIGSWKSHFQPHHIDLFKQYWGLYQIQMGYPLDFE